MSTRSALKHSPVKDSSGRAKHVTFHTPSRSSTASGSSSSNEGHSKQYAKSPKRSSTYAEGASSSKTPIQKRGSSSAQLVPESPQKRRREEPQSESDVLATATKAFADVHRVEEEAYDLAQRSAGITEKMAGVVRQQKSLVFRNNEQAFLQHKIEHSLEKKRMQMASMDEKIAKALDAKNNFMEVLSAARALANMEV